MRNSSDSDVNANIDSQNDRKSEFCLQILNLQCGIYLEVETYRELWINEENIRILSRVSGLVKHEYSKNMENLEMP